jgi:hypothetical protein
MSHETPARRSTCPDRHLGNAIVGPFSSGRERSTLGESGVEAAGEFEDEGVAISASVAADASPAVLALLACCCSACLSVWLAA